MLEPVPVPRALTCSHAVSCPSYCPLLLSLVATVSRNCVIHFPWTFNFPPTLWIQLPLTMELWYNIKCWSSTRLSLNNIMVWNIKCKHWMSNIIAQNFKTFVNFSIRTFDSCRIFSFIFSFSIRSFSLLTAPPLTWACRHQMDFCCWKCFGMFNSSNFWGQ